MVDLQSARMDWSQWELNLYVWSKFRDLMNLKINIFQNGMSLEEVGYHSYTQIPLLSGDYHDLGEK